MYPINQIRKEPACCISTCYGGREEVVSGASLPKRLIRAGGQASPGSANTCTQVVVVVALCSCLAALLISHHHTPYLVCSKVVTHIKAICLQFNNELLGPLFKSFAFEILNLKAHK